MTNAERFIGDEDLIDTFIDEFNEFACKQDWDLEYHCLKERLVEFFKQEVKPTLTEDERAILRHLKGFYYIYRANTGELEATNKEHTWCGYELYFDDDVFQFIKDGEEYSIEELLKGE